MSIPVRLQGSSGYEANTTSNKELITAPIRPDLVIFKELAEPNTAYNFYEPQQGKQMIVTGITAKADKQVSSTADATVIIYEATDATTTTVSKVIYQDVMVEGDRINLIGLNLLIAEGCFINAKTTDDDIHVNIFARYL